MNIFVLEDDLKRFYSSMYEAKEFLKEFKIKNKFANVRRIIAVKGLYKNETFEMKLSVLEFWIKQKGIWKLWSRQSVSLK